ncbi:glutamine synthetase family protein [Salinisphaera sp. SWV1]|uniref:glutamine synthetase family protein n=1 Tax=Salinisphaera sp. SWV1 TaxID=3454139 RepID=UPI003F8703A2
MSEDTSDPQIREWFNTNRISEVECLVPDITGEAKGKIMPAARYLNGERPRLPDSIFIQTATGDYPEDDEEIVDPAELDMQLDADLSTCRLVPWAREPTAQIIHECSYLNGEPVLVSPRYVLRRVLALYEKLGLRPVIAPEMEFYLVQRNTDADYPLQPPAGRSGRREISRRAYSIDAVNEFDPLFEDMYDYCEAESLDIDTLIHEEGSGQMEINFEHGDPLDLADQAFLFKRTLREVALAHGMYGTFMAKPMADEPGSSMHIHQSLVDVASGENAFADEAGEPTALFYQFIAGMQTYLPPALALLAPNVNSYRRLMPDLSNGSAPINTEWGYDNRTVGLRVPHSGRRGKRVENRIAGADVNPYLAIAASLACGYLGIRDKLEPRAPVADSAHARGHRLPSDMGRALEALADCMPLKTLLGERFIDTYLAVKRTEEIAHFKVISSWEREYLLLRV